MTNDEINTLREKAELYDFALKDVINKLNSM